MLNLKEINWKYFWIGVGVYSLFTFIFFLLKRMIPSVDFIFETLWVGLPPLLILKYFHSNRDFVFGVFTGIIALLIVL